MQYPTIELSHERERSHDPACLDKFLEDWTKIRVFHDSGQMVRKIKWGCLKRRDAMEAMRRSPVARLSGQSNAAHVRHGPIMAAICYSAPTLGACS
jgi:hypothetical protein